MTERMKEQMVVYRMNMRCMDMMAYVRKAFAHADAHRVRAEKLDYQLDRAKDRIMLLQNYNAYLVEELKKPGPRQVLSLEKFAEN